MGMQYNLTYEYVAIIISTILMVYVGTNKTTRISIHSKLFFSLILLNAITALADVLYYHGGTWGWPHWVNYLCSMVFIIAHLTMVPLYFFYFFTMSRKWNDYSMIRRAALSFPIWIANILLLLNPITKMFFYYDRRGLYVRGNSYYLLYIVVGFYIAAAIYMLLIHRKEFTVNRRVAGISYILLNIGGGIIQLLFEEIRIETFLIAFANLITFLLISNPQNNLDKETGLYNKETFIEIMETNFKNKKYLDLIKVVVTDYNDVEKKVGFFGQGSSAKNIGDFLRSIADNSRVYRIENDIYVIEILDQDGEVVDSIMSAILSRFKKVWTHHNMNIIYKTKLCHIDIPEQIDNIGCLLNMISDKKTGADKSIVEVDEFDLESFEREHSFNKVISSCMEDNQFEQLYSPLYNVKTGTVMAANVETFFMDKTYGAVSEKDIKIDKESLGRVIEVADILLEKCCKFFDEEHLANRGIRFIGIPVTSRICVEYKFFDSIEEYMKKYNINPRKMCFIISESMISSCPNEIAAHMKRLQPMGFKFCLSDYGSGFTNLSSVYEYDFDFISIHEAVFKSTCENEKAMITLRSVFSLAKALDMKTIISGIESEKQLNFAEALGCDYAQGPYFVKNINEKSFLEILDARLEIQAKADEGERIWEQI